MNHNKFNITNVKSMAMQWQVKTHWNDLND